MFTVNIQEKKDVFNHLLAVNQNLIFVQDCLCALQEGRYGFAETYMPIEVEKAIICKCFAVKELLKSPTIENVDFYPEEGKIDVISPFEFSPKIDIIEDERLIDDAKKRYDTLHEMLDIEEGDTYADKKGVDREVAVFHINNDELKDMLTQIGTADKIEITTGKKLTMRNYRNDYVIKHPQIKSSVEIRMFITDAARSVLRSSLINSPKEHSSDEEDETAEYSKIYIVDASFMVVKNSCTTILSSRVEVG